MLSSRFACSGIGARLGYTAAPALDRILLSSSVPTTTGTSPVATTISTSNCATLLGSIRHRYWDGKPKFRHWGYEDKVAWRGPLPRIPRETIQRVPEPPYAPRNSWTDKKALFGQNDYIDILGSPDVHPVRIAYDVPFWLKGFQGNEYQMLLRKRKFWGQQIRASNPEQSESLKKRMKYLWKFINWKRKTLFDRKK